MRGFDLLTICFACLHRIQLACPKWIIRFALGLSRFSISLLADSKKRANNVFTLNTDSKVNHECLVSRVRVASDFFEKFVGLLESGRCSIDEGLLLDGTQSVHGFGMKEQIGVVALKCAARGASNLAAHQRVFEVVDMRVLYPGKTWQPSRSKGIDAILELNTKKIPSLKKE